MKEKEEKMEKLKLKRKEEFSPNHILEQWLYQYYYSLDEVKISEGMQHVQWKNKAYEQMQNKNYNNALQLLQEAFSYNPTDLETLRNLAYTYYSLNDLNQMKDVAEYMYYFCYTIQDIAVYYRLLGCYYLENYQPDLSAALYSYSNLLDPTKQAEAELAYLERALQKPMKVTNNEFLQSVLSKNHIKIQPANETLGILYYTAQEAKESGDISYAKVLFTYLNRLTNDVEIQDILKSL